MQEAIDILQQAEALDGHKMDICRVEQEAYEEQIKLQEILDDNNESAFQTPDKISKQASEDSIFTKSPNKTDKAAASTEPIIENGPRSQTMDTVTLF